MPKMLVDKNDEDAPLFSKINVRPQINASSNKPQLYKADC